MKKLFKNLCLVSGVLLSFPLFAGEREILKDSKEMNVVLNTLTVRCSSFGYGMRELKVNIAGLDGWTLFDHTNILFGDKSDLPCMTAGACRLGNREGGFSVDDILQQKPRTERIVVNREVAENRFIGDNNNQVKVCFRVLAERLQTVIGGVEFTHTRTGEVLELPTKACTF